MKLNTSLIENLIKRKVIGIILVDGMVVQLSCQKELLRRLLVKSLNGMITL